ncbi:MAG: hypothetical protein JWO91_3847 [Acidobacteriaceae bacterium]|nr:hypothetical protein [Acidobacteriaceae bacterium]
MAEENSIEIYYEIRNVLTSGCFHNERPETKVTDRTGHIGYTFSLWGGVNALEGVFGNG